jgi:hypothetical protein
MADVFYTILIVWVLWRILGGSTRTYVFHKHSHTTQQAKKDGDVSVSYKKPEEKKPDSGGEYIDYEEIK